MLWLCRGGVGVGYADCDLVDCKQRVFVYFFSFSDRVMKKESKITFFEVHAIFCPVEIYLKMAE